jgi:predicted transcriptional regulator
MKTTVDISDDLLRRSQRIAKNEHTTLRAILEEGIRLVLKTRQAKRQAVFKFPTFGEGGLSDEFRHAGWNQVRDAIYRDGKPS